MILFGFTIFLSAFLLFLVQPMVAKAILPWFGGAPAVWNTCMFFFQALLVGGYGYAHWLADGGRFSRGSRVHLAVLGSAVLLLTVYALKWGAPIVPDPSMASASTELPALRILGVLALSVGLPFLTLSATGPLLQWWFGQLFPNAATYRLYALSNLGSLLALLAYPFLLEPSLTLKQQGLLWGALFVVFAVSCGRLALRLRNASPIAKPVSAEPEEDTRGPSRLDLALWTALAACSSVALLATTSHLSNEVAPTPFLWLLPLGLYLLTFVLCFESDRWYRRTPFLVALFGVTLLVGYALEWAPKLHGPFLVVSFCLGQFVIAMICHGELARLRPAPRHLTVFYLTVSIGGALGGLLVSFVAPVLFDSYVEFPASYIWCWLLVVAVLAKDRASIIHDRLKGRRARSFLAAVVLVSTCGLLLITSAGDQRFAYRHRNFYGVVQVAALDDGPEEERYSAMLHGRIVHGAQLRAPGREREPTGYYWRESGIGLAIEQMRKRLKEEGRPMRIGLVGLGVGVIAAYGEPGDVFRFYELNPEVVRIAEGKGGYFSFLSDSPATIEVVEGDARLTLQAELDRGEPGRFDILVLDAYGGDAVPMHLLTKQAMEIYLKHLRDERSLLAFHTSNNFLRLAAVVEALARDFSLHHLGIDARGDSFSRASSTWELVARTPEALAIDRLEGRPSRPPSTPVRTWSDDYCNLFEILGAPKKTFWNDRPADEADGSPAIASPTQ